MTVADLQGVLAAAAQLLTAGGGRGGGELTALSAQLDRFAGHKLSAFTELLGRVSVDGSVTPRPSSPRTSRPAKSSAVDPAVIAAEARRLYDRAADTTIPQAEFDALYALLPPLTKASLGLVAEAVGMRVPSNRRVAELVSDIRRWIDDRRGKILRNQTLDPAKPPTAA